MSKVRVKHQKDPTAVPSFGEGPDEHGGYLVDEKDLEQANAHGFHVKHLHDETTEPVRPAKKQSEKPPVDPLQAGDGDETTQDADQADAADATDETDATTDSPPAAGEQRVPRRRPTK